jgi:hypothetical protein
MKRHATHKHPHGSPFNSPSDPAAQDPSYFAEPGRIEVMECNSGDDDFRPSWDLEDPKEITECNSGDDDFRPSWDLEDPKEISPSNPEEEFRYEHLENAGILLKLSVLTVRYAGAGFCYSKGICH